MSQKFCGAFSKATVLLMFAQCTSKRLNGLHNVVGELFAGATGVTTGDLKLLFGEHTDIKCLFERVGAILETNVRKKHNRRAEH